MLLGNPTSYAQPSWNDGDSIQRAQSRVEAARSLADSRAAYDTLLYAVGNNHAGTYFPVVLALFPFFESVLRNGSEWPRITILEALTDLCLSFTPEPGYELHPVSVGEPLSVEAHLRQWVASLGVLLQEIASGSGKDAEHARELLRGLPNAP